MKPSGFPLLSSPAWLLYQIPKLPDSPSQWLEETTDADTSISLLQALPQAQLGVSQDIPSEVHMHTQTHSLLPHFVLGIVNDSDAHRAIFRSKTQTISNKVSLKISTKCCCHFLAMSGIYSILNTKVNEQYKSTLTKRLNL